VHDVFAAGIAAKAIHWQVRHNNFRIVRRLTGSIKLYGGNRVPWQR
jgi:hypothetical protein